MSVQQEGITADKSCKTYSNLFIRQYNLESDLVPRKKISNLSAQTQSTASSEIKVKDFLVGHKIKQQHRGRMIDWMIQVFRVLNRSNDKTLFLASAILDRFFEAS